MAIIQISGLAGSPPWFLFLHLFWKRTFGDKWHRFFTGQPTMPTYWRKWQALTSAWCYPFFTQHTTADGRVIACLCWLFNPVPVPAIAWVENNNNNPFNSSNEVYPVSRYHKKHSLTHTLSLWLLYNIFSSLSPFPMVHSIFLACIIVGSLSLFLWPQYKFSVACL